MNRSSARSGAATSSSDAPFDAADFIVACLESIGVDLVFGVPDGAIEPLHDALARSARRGGPKAVMARHETGAAYMADGHARETGRIGVCIAGSGPGATNVITGVACAFDKGIPMLVITGQPPIHSFGRGALPESSCAGIDTVGMLKHCTRYNSLVSHPEQLSIKLFNALMHASRAPIGPSHLSIPVDLLRSPSPARTPSHDFGALLRGESSLSDLGAIDALAAALTSAARPVFLIGDGCGEAVTAILQLVQATQGQFITTPDGKGFVNPRHPAFRGVFGFGGHESADTLLRSEPDLLIALGTGFGELSGGVWSRSTLNRRLVHVDSCDENLMRSPMARMHVRGRIVTICEQLVQRIGQGRPANVLPFRDRRSEQRAMNALPTQPNRPRSDATAIAPQRLMAELSRRCPPRTRFVADAGHSAAWAVHCLEPNERRLPRTQGGMLPAERRGSRSSWLRVTTDFAPSGWAIGAGIGVAAANPQCPVVCITSAASVLKNGQEITVAAALGLTVLFVVLDPVAAGAGDHLHPPVDHAAMAIAMGIPGHVIRSPADFDAIDFDGLLKRRGPTLLDVRIDGDEAAPFDMRGDVRR